MVWKAYTTMASSVEPFAARLVAFSLRTVFVRLSAKVSTQYHISHTPVRLEVLEVS
jgi:hypothetical protein